MEAETTTEDEKTTDADTAAGSPRHSAKDDPEIGPGADQTDPSQTDLSQDDSSQDGSRQPVRPHGALHELPASRLLKTPGRPDAVAVGTIIWLASDLMFFAGIFAAYFTLRSVTTAIAVQNGTTPVWEQGTALLNVPVALANTTVLVLSSVTCQLGVFCAEKGRVGRTGSIFNPLRWGLREWYVLTFVMGAVFIAGQVYEYASLVSDGLTLSSDPYGSIFYLATGFHGLHVLSGLIAFVLLLGRTYLARTFTHEQAVSAIAVSYYWHFVDVVWIALFGTVYLLQ